MFINTATKQFPLYLGDLQELDPTFTLGHNLPENIAECLVDEQPLVSNYWEQYTTQNEPQLIDGQWRITWTVNDYAPGEYIAQNINNPNARLPFGPWSWDVTNSIWFLSHPLAKATHD